MSEPVHAYETITSLRVFRASHRKERIAKLQAPRDTTTLRFVRP